MSYRTMKWLLLSFFCFCLISGVLAEDILEEEKPSVEPDLGSSREASRTDDEVVKREEEAIKLDGLNVSEIKELREKAEKHHFQAEVNRMMKLIINSLYRNKEIFLRELISNASDALDKIRVLSLTDSSVLSATDEFSIRIKSDKENNILHITDTGIGMTKAELIGNLGTIAKSGTSEFLKKVGETQSATELSDMIGQFGVGFYSSFLVADKIVVTSKHNDDKQHIWESDSYSFSIVDDPRGDTLKRGTTISLYLKEEAHDFLEEKTLSELIKKYSQFINFNIYLWTSKTETVEEPIPESDTEVKQESSSEEDEVINEEKESKPKTKKVKKTISNWELMNASKPIWTRKPADITDDEYNEFYKSITKDTSNPFAKTHFVAEGEVSFKSLLYIPSVQPSDSFNKYGTKVDHIKLFVRRVFITDDFQDIMPNYLSFVKGLVDSDDLPLNVSRETLQQHKLLKVIRKKLIRKTLDMIKKISKEDYDTFWREYSTNIKLGMIEDPSNRMRLAKLMRFNSSRDLAEYTSLLEYIERMKENQDHIYYAAGLTLDEVQHSPFVESLLKKGFEILYLTEAVDEYALNSIPEFEGKKIVNVAKDGFKFDESEQAKKTIQYLTREFEPLTKWMTNKALKNKIAKAIISQRLDSSPCALVASRFGWSGNMERLARSNAHSKMHDHAREYLVNQKKTLEVNPRHPLIMELLRRVKADKSDVIAKNMAKIMFDTAVLRSGYTLPDSLGFAKRVEILLRKTLGISKDAEVQEEELLGQDEELASEEEELKNFKLKSEQNVDDEYGEDDEDEDVDDTERFRDEL